MATKTKRPAFLSTRDDKAFIAAQKGDENAKAHLLTLEERREALEVQRAAAEDAEAEAIGAGKDPGSEVRAVTEEILQVEGEIRVARKAVERWEHRVREAEEAAHRNALKVFTEAREKAVRDLNTALEGASAVNQALADLDAQAREELGDRATPGLMHWPELLPETENHASRLAAWQRFVRDAGISL